MSAVLVVDDTAHCTEPLARLLQKSGHTVRCAANGREALATLIRFQPDVIILDMHMPVMDGVTFLHAMRTPMRRGETSASSSLQDAGIRCLRQPGRAWGGRDPAEGVNGFRVGPQSGRVR